MHNHQHDLLRASAREILALLAAGQLSAVELLAETRARYDAVNPLINAVVSADFETAERTARASDARRASGAPVRPLEGLPLAVKDLEETAGLRTTYGSTFTAEHVPEVDSVTVARLRAAGAVIYGKTNVPELGAGSHTRNRVFGTTTNPYDPTRSAGGSSGGAAAALAAGLSVIADGSDMGGSLRNPASFCNVVGLRPSIGRVPNFPFQRDPWQTLSTNGPMARTVADTALLLNVMSGPDPHSPLSYPVAPIPDPLPAPGRLRIGWSRRLSDLDIAPPVTEVLDSTGLPTLIELGHVVTDREPQLVEADRAFRVLRGLGFVRTHAAELEVNRDRLSPEIVANTEFGMTLTAADYVDALGARARVYEVMRELFEHIDVLAAPVAAVPPFPAEWDWPREIAGVRQNDYLQWMRACWRISLTGFVALSIPCGYTAEGLPIGLQLIAPPGREPLVLALAQQFERARPAWTRAPRILSRPPTPHAEQT